MQRLDLSIGSIQGLGDVGYGKIYGIYLLPAYFRRFDATSCNVLDMWRVRNSPLSNGASSLARSSSLRRLGFVACAQQLFVEWCLVVGTILKR